MPAFTFAAVCGLQTRSRLAPDPRVVTVAADLYASKSSKRDLGMDHDHALQRPEKPLVTDPILSLTYMTAPYGDSRLCPLFRLTYQL